MLLLSIPNLPFTRPKSMGYELARFALLLSLASNALGDQPEPLGWTLLNSGEYRATIGPWILKVDPQKARLTHLERYSSSNRLAESGHRVWLGPQGEWPEFWPPPTDWESSPAISHHLSPDLLTLTLLLPHTSPHFPQLARTYQLHPEGLDLGVSWKPNSNPTPLELSGPQAYQAVHILQLAPEATVKLRIQPTRELPLGYGLLPLLHRREIILNRPLSPGFFKASPSPTVSSVLQFTGQEEKIGVPLQPLWVHFPEGDCFRLEPATFQGQPSVLPPPEAGLYSQIYFGADQWPMVEVEQLSPRLEPTTPGEAVSVTVHLHLPQDRKALPQTAPEL